MTLLTVEKVDEAIAEISMRRLFPLAELPEFIDTEGLRVITETNHKNALINGGLSTIYVETRDVVNRLLDLRNEISAPIRTIPKESE